ncbi:MAG: transcription-repair coupling factor, partial [Pseudomonadota bacterium]|nr:transcription-repair coupling factor [Pseudomonadota bacterium]
DLFGEIIEGIRLFDPETQRSDQSTTTISLLPAREFPITSESIDLFRQNFRRLFEGDPQQQQVYRDVSRGNPSQGIDYYFPLFFENTETLFDYLPNAIGWVIDRELPEASDTFWSGIRDRHAVVAQDSQRHVLPPHYLFQTTQELTQQMADQQVIHLTRGCGSIVSYDTQLPAEYPVKTNNDSPYDSLISHLRKTNRTILIVADSLGRKEILKEIIESYGFNSTDSHWKDIIGRDSTVIHFCVGLLERGLILGSEQVEVITNAQLYGRRINRERRFERSARDPHSIIRSLAELNIGDPIVHDEHGVGRYLGLETLGIEQQNTEFLTIEYRDGDRLYVPVLSLDVVNRYIGGQADEITLNKLGTEDWSRSKKRAQEKTYDVVVELLELQAVRQGRVGSAMDIPAREYISFSSCFPYEETPDQLSAMSEVLTDLESCNPMDRMICGDVGFGKTEIALRAAFIAVHNNKQVAVLVPTTLLAQQHFNTFIERFSGTAINIGLLSRFRGSADNKALLRALRDGTPDIVIGTHRLLQGDIAFKDLGLLIIDEEHRFGVRQKERLKQLRREVDILALTATPIPRSLNLGLSGLREISVIGTPPKGRLAVKTFVQRWNDALVRDACLRELHRAGQIYFLHNSVQTIDRTAERLRALIPEATIGVAHGQQPERELERVMQDFYHQRFNLLICTTIIESGIDIPSANTIIIDRADRMGMAQLHQLRGRVGRSNHQAYAYLIVPPPENMTNNAERRLNAISSLSELGAGFALASHDLEIRGAGQLLGEKQSGAIDEIGFSLYSDYLHRAIRELSTSDRALGTDVEPCAVDINLNVTALLPEDYLPDVHERLIFYKRLANTTCQEEIKELQLEAIDRFGLLPEASRTLFRVTQIKLAAGLIGIEKLHLGHHGGEIRLSEKTSVDPAFLLQMIHDTPKDYRIRPGNVIHLTTPLEVSELRLDRAEAIVAALSGKTSASLS